MLRTLFLMGFGLLSISSRADLRMHCQLRGEGGQVGLYEAVSHIEYAERRNKSDSDVMPVSHFSYGIIENRRREMRSSLDKDIWANHTRINTKWNYEESSVEAVYDIQFENCAVAGTGSLTVAVRPLGSHEKAKSFSYDCACNHEPMNNIWATLDDWGQAIDQKQRPTN